jgi:hypothetical protein
MKRLHFGAVSAIALFTAATTAQADPKIDYVPNSLKQSIIDRGPWTLHESGDNFGHDASGIVPPKSQPSPPYTGTGVPYAFYCAGGQVQVNHTRSLMQPFYFPLVRQRGDVLEGFFDYRPRNEEEATVSAISTDWGVHWTFTGKALALNPSCPADPTDPDNLNVIVNGAVTKYGLDPNSAGDNGLGHSFILNAKGKSFIYHLNRANGHIDSDPLVVHRLGRDWDDPLFGLPMFGFVSPLSGGGYPMLEPTAMATTGLTDPDAILGAVRMHEDETAIIYVSKNLTTGEASFQPSQICPGTPAFALTNLINGKVRKANHDVISIRVATTSDGINFKDVGEANGLEQPTNTALNAIRWLGSGSIMRIADGRYGMFFGAGSCLDNDSDGFHFIGYAETVDPVRKPSDLLNWHVVKDFDHPILSTDTVVDPSSHQSYPANPPLVNVTGADALSAAQVAPFPRPNVINGTTYSSNFFSGRSYDPQAVWTDEHTVTIVFAGYNTPQPSNNLGDYRTIGRFQLRFPDGYFSPPGFGRDDD